MVSNDKQMLRQLGVLLRRGRAGAVANHGGAGAGGARRADVVGGILFSGKSIKFDLKRLNPLSGLKRIFSSRVLAELLKGS